MMLTSTSERLGAALARSSNLWEARLKAESHTGAGAEQPAAFCVAISREAGTDAAAVAGQLGTRLGWPVYDRELLRKIAEETGLRGHLVDSVDEKRKNWVASLFEGILSSHPGSEEAYIRHLSRVLLSLAARGECILVGRGAPQILPSEHTLRVRLIAPLPDRIRAYAKKHGISRDEAARKVDEIDKQRNRFVRETFNKDPSDPRDYDLILNTARFSAAECAELIEQALLRVQAPTRATSSV
jgi:cytidylate kinase